MRKQWMRTLCTAIWIFCNSSHLISYELANKYKDIHCQIFAEWTVPYNYRCRNIRLHIDLSAAVQASVCAITRAKQSCLPKFLIDLALPARYNVNTKFYGAEKLDNALRQRTKRKAHKAKAFVRCNTCQCPWSIKEMQYKALIRSVPEWRCYLGQPHQKLQQQTRNFSKKSC